jgi:tetratricopeptide (TPR) repeat protein
MMRRWILLAVVSGLLPAGARASDPVRDAWDAYRLGEFDRAVRLFQEGGRTNPAAGYGLATTWAWRRPKEDRLRAEKLYREVIALAPESEWAIWSWLGLARLLHVVPVGQEPDYPKVRAAYQAVIDRFPRHPAGVEALLQQQATLVATLEPADAAAAYRRLGEFLAEQPESPYRSAAHALRADCLATLGRPVERLAESIRAWETREIDPSNPRGAEMGWTYWRLATLAEFEAGDFATARKFYQKLITEYPRDQRVFPAKQALARMAALEERLRAEGARR